MNIFSRTGGLKPGRSYFDLSYPVLFDCNAGELIPVMCDEMVPGDFFDISNECIVRMQPLVSPVLHGMNITVHYFFVPYRLLWTDWEKFITGGIDGQDTSVLPRWTPDTVAKGSLWDYLGFPLVVPQGLARPISFPLRAYKFIRNEYYRDETLQAAVDITNDAVSQVFNRDWRKDYFTSALPWQQRGIAPALPISGIAPAVFDFGDGTIAAGRIARGAADGASTTSVFNVSTNASSVGVWAGSSPNQPEAQARLQLTEGLEQYLSEHNLVDLSEATTFNVADLRLAIQTQKFLERNARAGVRYIEFLREHFHVSPRDDRLQRPEYIGGSKQPIIISEVLKTSQDGSRPQGNLAGHGLSASMAKVARYHCKEFGLVMGIMSIMPENVYNSQGFDRQWLRRSKFDFYFPEFAHLSEQAIEREEIYATAVEEDCRTVWGFQGRYDEMRVKRGKVARNLRDTLNYWHMARTFSAAPALNDAFLQVNGSEAGGINRIFAVPSEPGFIVHFGNVIKASRPLPSMSEPGLMDHF